MSCNVVCRVKARGQVSRPVVEFVWCEGSASFPPIVLDPPETATFNENARDARQKLFAMVSLHVPPEDQRDAAAIQQACFDLATAGRYLYNQLLPTHDPTGADVRQWLEDLTRSQRVASLEIVCDGEPWCAPWNIVYDEDPDDGRFGDTSAGLDQRFGPFWGIRHALCGSLPVSPLRRNPLPASPDTLLIIDPVVSEELRSHDDGSETGQWDAFEAFLAEAEKSGVRVRLADSRRALKQALKAARPDVMYWLCHAEPEKLSLGDDEITLKDLDNLLNEVRVGKTGVGLVILNACRTAESGTLGSFLKAFHDRGYCGIIATEERTLDNFANPFGLGLLRGILGREGTIVSMATSLRRKSLPLGLLYGAYCPPNLYVSRTDEAAAQIPLEQPALTSARAGIVLESQTHTDHAAAVSTTPAASRILWPPLPVGTPYLPLGIYGPEHRALFAGRDEDVERFALVLDHSETRILVLHGESGVGKSSFLRAGVLPYLEDECIGYYLLRDRSVRLNGDRSPVLFVRSTDDPIGQLAQALCAFCNEPYAYATPSGSQVTIDLARKLGDAMGPGFPAAGPAISDVRATLASDPERLREVFAAVAADLPFTLVVVVDQAEEMFTLAVNQEQLARRDLFLESLRRVASAACPVKLIISLRTEFYGRLIDRLRRGVAGATGVRDYLLTDLDRQGLIEAICRPTLTHSIRYADQVPAQVYGFRYAPGVAEAIAAELMQTGQRDGVLPLAQFLCDQLYRRARERGDPTVTHDDFEQIGRLGGGLRRHLEQQLERLAPGRPVEQNAFKELLAHLTHRQADGTLTSGLLREDRLAPLWRGSTPFPKILAVAEGLRLLRFSTRQLDGGTQQRFISLGHDALAPFADTWREEAARRVRFRRMFAVAAGASAIAACMAVLAILALVETRKAERERNAAEAAGRRIQLQSTIRDLLAERPDGDAAQTEPQLDLIYSLIPKLAALDPAEAAAQSRLLSARVARAIEAEMDAAEGNSPPFTLDQTAALERRIARLVAEPLVPGDRLREDIRWLRRRLIDYYRRLDRDDKALAIAEELLLDNLSREDRLGLTMDYCWMMILAGRAADAFPIIDRFIDKHSRKYDPALLPMLIDRARLNAAQRQYDQAEAEVERVIREITPESITYPVYAQAYLLRGALWNRRGEPNKALEAWRVGSYRKWAAHISDEPIPSKKLDSRGVISQNFVSYYAIIMGAVTGELTAEDLAFALQFRIQKLPDVFTESKLSPTSLASNLDFLSTPFLVKAVNVCYQTPRGKNFIERLAFHQISYKGRLVEAFLHAVVALVRHSAITEGIPEEVEPAVWELMVATLDDFEKKKLNVAHLAQFIATYTGVTGRLGWAGLSPALRPNTIPGVAFIMGHRYRVLKRREDARMFFQIVIEKAPVHSPLKKWASKAIGRIDQEKTR
jgi:tetratricopeptide (TPR) repeat protein